jgi:hypothetical protein
MDEKKMVTVGCFAASISICMTHRRLESETRKVQLARVAEREGTLGSLRPSKRRWQPPTPCPSGRRILVALYNKSQEGILVPGLDYAQCCVVPR